MLKKQPTALKCLAKEMDFDMLCLQETKLQEMHLDDPKLNLRALLKEDGYDDYWSCSTARKGYSGTAVFVKHREITSAPELPISVKNLIATDVSFKIGKEIDNEGRTVVVKFPWATIVNVSTRSPKIFFWSHRFLNSLPKFAGVCSKLRPRFEAIRLPC